MKLFFASQFLIASLLMIWNATKKGLWDSFTFKKAPSKSIVKIADRTLGSEPSIPYEKNTIFLANNELPHFEDSLVPLLSPRIESPKNNLNLNQEQFPEDTNIDAHLVSSFTTNVINKDWEFHQSSPEIVQGFGQKIVERNDFFPTKPVLQPKDKIPLIAAGLSLIPGLGHAYIEDPQTAGALMTSATIGHGLFLSMYYSDAFFGLLNSNENASVYLSTMRFAQTTEFYGIFAAYRDARTRFGSSGYSYKMPTDNLMSLTRAPFDLQVLKKPEVWGGIIGTLALARGVMWLAGPMERAEASVVSTTSLLSLPVSIGEESFFRGFLQSELSEHLTPWGGIAASTVAFAAAHIPRSFEIAPSTRWRYYAFNLPLHAAVGAYFGYLTQKNTSLKESVAVHTWYDFALMTSNALLYSASTGNYGFATSIPF